MEKNTCLSPCKKCEIKCCMKLTVPITIFDSRRIMKKTQSKIEDFALLVDYRMVKQNLYNSIFFIDKDGELEEKILVLKKVNTACVFFNNELKCSIWGDHPLACKCYPFYIFNQKTKKLEYVKNFLCPREWNEDEKKCFDFKKAIERLEYENKIYNKIIVEWNVLHSKKDIKDFFYWLENYKLNESLDGFI